MIEMYCDKCDEEVDGNVNGGCRLRTGNRELSFHLCAVHQRALRKLVEEFCDAHSPREVTTSLANTDTRKEKRS